jgi:hypothetical protein
MLASQLVSNYGLTSSAIHPNYFESFLLCFKLIIAAASLN